MDIKLTSSGHRLEYCCKLCPAYLKHRCGLQDICTQVKAVRRERERRKLDRYVTDQVFKNRARTIKLKKR